MNDLPRRHGQPDNERIGIYVIVGFLLLIVLIAFAFVYVGNLAGIIVFIAIAGFVFYVLFSWDRRGPIEVAPEVHDDVRRTLVFVDADVDPGRLARKLSTIDEDGRELHVIVPARTDVVHRAASDIDDARESAEERVEAIRSALAASFGRVGGGVGDPDEELALEDALRTYPADELVLVNAEPGRRDTLQQAATERAQRDVPLRLIEVTIE